MGLERGSQASHRPAMATKPRPGPKHAAPSDPASIKAGIRAEASRLGFDSVGFASADAPAIQGERLRAFVDAGWHGDMAWMAETTERRADPRGLWPEARTVIALGLNYGPDVDPRVAQARTDLGAISVYAHGRDYHRVVKTRLKALGSWIWNCWGHELTVFVDTAPVMEKPAAARAGIGWQGKHTNLVSREHGSWLFLGEILIALDLPPDAPETDHCGSCSACVAACPTAAIVAPYKLDARRCISYLTIEHAGPIPRALRPAIGNRIYGCDDCLAACPWNKFAATARETAFAARDTVANQSLGELAGLDDAAFRTRFTTSAIKRVGRDRFVRNVAIALGNGPSTTDAIEAVARLLDDASPAVRGAAIWALDKLSPDRALAEAARHLDGERDPDVRAEWNGIDATPSA